MTRARTLLASALSVSVLVITAACAAHEREVPRALPQGCPSRPPRPRPPRRRRPPR
ncbi:hypothetical protein ACFQV4_01850 [Streptomyces thermocarboxydus]